MSQLRAMKRNQNRNIAKQVKTAEDTFQDGFRKGYVAGTKDGIGKGRIVGSKETIDLFCDALETLQKLKDIGPKRYQAILKHLGYMDASEIRKENRWKE